MKMEVSVGVSNRHVHLTEEMYAQLFDEKMTKRNDLKQPGQFASNQLVTIKTEKSEIPNVRVLGPCRSYNQIEISASDARKLGINPPVRDSGDLDDSLVVTLVTDKASIDVKGCIIARRHVHMSVLDAKKYGVSNLHPIRLIIKGKKGGILNGVVKLSEKGVLEAHVDTDEASAMGLNTGDMIEFEIEK